MFDGEIDFLCDIANMLDSAIQSFNLNSKEEDKLRAIYDDIIDRVMELKGE
jgi:hypothetical protein